MTTQIVLTNEQAGKRYTIEGNIVVVDVKSGSTMEWQREVILSLNDLREVVEAANRE